MAEGGQGVGHPVCVVSICGPSNAGKSQLAKRTAELLGEGLASRVPTDYFMVPRPIGVPIEDFLNAPSEFDWDLLWQRLRLPVGTASSTPDLGFETYERRGDVGGLPFTVRPWMLCDAMQPVPAADLVVKMDAPESVRRERVRHRDRRWGSRVAERWTRVEAIWEGAAGVVPDVRLDGTAPIENNAIMLAARLRQSGAGRIM